MLTADDLHRRPVCFFIELPRVVIPAVVVEVSGVDVEHQLAELGGVGFQAARRDDLFFLHLAEHPNIIVRGRFEVDVKLRALRHDVGIDILSVYCQKVHQYTILIDGFANHMIECERPLEHDKLIF